MKPPNEEFEKCSIFYYCKDSVNERETCNMDGLNITN